MNGRGKGRQGAAKGHKEELSQKKDDKQPTNRFGRTNHKCFKAQVHFLLFEHDLNFPMIGIVSQDILIRKG